MSDCCETCVQVMASETRILSPSTADRNEYDVNRDMTPTNEDIDDIRATLNGDETAYARLVDRYETPIFAQMWRFTRDRRVLEELVQDVFVEAYTSLGRFRGEAPFLHWLRAIATRVGYHHWKRERRDRKHRLAIQEHAQRVPRPNQGMTPDDASERLFALLAHLVPKDRLVLTLYYFEEYDTNEIAEQTGWSVTLVRVRIYRACRRLRRLITEAGYEQNAQ